MYKTRNFCKFILLIKWIWVSSISFTNIKANYILFSRLMSILWLISCWICVFDYYLGVKSNIREDYRFPEKSRKDTELRLINMKVWKFEKYEKYLKNMKNDSCYVQTIEYNKLLIDGRISRGNLIITRDRAKPSRVYWTCWKMSYSCNGSKLKEKRRLFHFPCNLSWPKNKLSLNIETK